MSAGRSVLKGMAMTVAASGAVLAARQAAASRAALRFYERTGERVDPFDAGTFHGGGPVVWHRSESSETLHTASLEAVRAILPSSELHPVRLSGGRAIIYVGSLQHGVMTANGVDGRAMLPYGEVMVLALVTRRPAPPLLPLVAPASTGLAAGGFVLHLPVTTRVARDGGRALGYPKFTADIEFEDSIEMCRSHLAEGGHSVLTHTVRPAGRPSVTGAPLILYASLDGRLMEQRVPTFGLRRRRWGRQGGYLELGDHQVADELRALDIDPEPFLATHVSGMRLAMSASRSVGPARPYLGYIGDERDLGRYVVRYPGTAPIDQYAPFAPTAGPAPAIMTSAPAAELATVRA